jgi:DNA polymerase-3 subunit alpha
MFFVEEVAPDGDDYAPLPDVPEWPDKEKLGFEKHLLGIYLSSHPLMAREPQLRLFRSLALNELSQCPPKKEVIVAGMVSGIRVFTQKRGRNANQRYARFMIEDLGAIVSCVMFADAYALYGANLVDEAVVFLKAQVDTPLANTTANEGEIRTETVSLIVNEIIRFDDASTVFSSPVMIRIDSRRFDVETLDRVAQVIRMKPGHSPIYLELLTPDGLRVRMRTENLSIKCDSEAIRLLEETVGPGCVSLAARQANGTSNGNHRRNGSP